MKRFFTTIALGLMLMGVARGDSVEYGPTLQESSSGSYDDVVHYDGGDVFTTTLTGNFSFNTLGANGENLGIYSSGDTSVLVPRSSIKNFQIDAANHTLKFGNLNSSDKWTLTGSDASLSITDASSIYFAGDYATQAGSSEFSVSDGAAITLGANSEIRMGGSVLNSSSSSADGGDSSITVSGAESSVKFSARELSFGGDSLKSGAAGDGGNSTLNIQDGNVSFKSKYANFGGTLGNSADGDRSAGNSVVTISGGNVTFERWDENKNTVVFGGNCESNASGTQAGNSTFNVTDGNVTFNVDEVYFGGNATFLGDSNCGNADLTFSGGNTVFNSSVYIGAGNGIPSENTNILINNSAEVTFNASTHFAWSGLNIPGPGTFTLDGGKINIGPNAILQGGVNSVMDVNGGSITFRLADKTLADGTRNFSVGNIVVGTFNLAEGLDAHMSDYIRLDVSDLAEDVEYTGKKPQNIIISASEMNGVTQNSYHIMGPDYDVDLIHDGDKIWISKLTRVITPNDTEKELTKDISYINTLRLERWEAIRNTVVSQRLMDSMYSSFNLGRQKKAMECDPTIPSACNACSCGGYDPYCPACSPGVLSRGQSYQDLYQWNVWVSGYGMSGNREHADFTAWGGVIGAERRMNDRLHFGLFGEYGGGDMKTECSFGETKVDVNEYTLGAYARWDSFLTGGYTLALGNFIWNEFDSWRSFDATASFAGQQYGFYYEKGWEHRFNHVKFNPYLAVQYQYVTTDGYTESGVSRPLDVDGYNLDSLRTYLGLRSVICITDSFAILATGTYVHEFGDEYWDINVGYEGRRKVTIQGAGLGKDWGQVGVGMRWNPTDHFSIYGNYDLILGDAMLHSGFATLEFTF